MAKSSKSATLPPNLRVVSPPSDESDSFFSKLKKRFKFKKGRYNVDVNTGECENVSVVSFKKRSSAELLDAQESPLKHNVGRSSERITRSESPKQAKPASRTQSDRYMTTYFGHRPKVEVKTPPTGCISLPGRKGSDKGSLDSLDKKKDKLRSDTETSSNKNEYSAINYEKQDPHITKPFTFVKDSTVVNDCVATDDNTIDLDNVDIDMAAGDAIGATPVSVAVPPRDLSPLEPGYESLPEVLQRASLIQTPLSPEEPGYESVRDVRKTIREQNLDSGKLPEAGGADFDPNYESVDDVKKKMSANMKASDRTLMCSESLDSLDDPRYQSVKDAKRKPPKTYDITKSIESLDEPGYESLNDVKKRISTMDFDKNVPNSSKGTVPGSSRGTIPGSSRGTVPGSSRGVVERAESNELTDSAKSKDSGFESRSEKSIDVEDNLYSKVNKKKADSPVLEDLYSTVKKNASNGSKVTSASSSGVAVSGDSGKTDRKTGNKVATVGSGVSVSGGGSKTDRKSGNVVASGLAQVESLIGAIVTGLTRTESDGGATVTTEATVDSGAGAKREAKTDVTVEAKVCGVETKADSVVKGKSSVDDKASSDGTDQAKAEAGDDKVAPPDVKKADEIDSETELILDPGYAECADAIKGYNPYSLYSDGSGSKISSCASLDLSAEDFVVEPGYAECADAIKTGAIKKISVSHEKLVVTERPVVESSILEADGASEIYAVPQVLFRKRSKLLEERSSGEFSMTSLNSDTDLVGSMESVQSHSSVKSGKDEELKRVEEASSEAPPLPARNYSLYLENEEAEEILPSALIDEKIAENDGDDDDDAFEKECSDTPKLVGDTSESRRRNESSGFVVSEQDDASEVHLNKHCVNAEERDLVDQEQMHDTHDGNSIKVIVEEKDGDKKVLTVIEKQPSLRIQQKRKAQSATNDETVLPCSSSCVTDVHNSEVKGSGQCSKTDLSADTNVGSMHCHSVIESERSTLNANETPDPPPVLPARNYSESDKTEEPSCKPVIENSISGNCIGDDDDINQTAERRGIPTQFISNTSRGQTESELLQQKQVDIGNGNIDNASFNVAIDDVDGCIKMLTIREKTPSFKIQQKRNARKTNNEISTQCSTSAICTNHIQHCDEICDRSNSDAKDNLETDCFQSGKLPVSSQTYNVVNAQLPCSTTEELNCFPDETTGIETDHAYHGAELSSEINSGTDTDCHATVGNSEVIIKIESQLTLEEATMSAEMSEFQPQTFFNDRNMFRPSGLELTGMLSEEEELLKRSVKMNSISVDSDSDESPGLDHLPVLAINESDLEDAFDDNGTDFHIKDDDTIVTDAATGCTDIDDRNGRKDGPKNSRASQLVSNEMPKFNVSQDSGLFLSEHNTIEEKLCESSMNKDNASLDDPQQLCVVNSSNELDNVAASSANSNSNDLVNFYSISSIDTVNNAADMDGHESGSDDEDEEACDIEDKGHDSGCECCMEKGVNGEESHSLNTELKALPRDLNPDLYADTEPTHMSLAEVMGATSPSTSGFKLSSSMDECLFASVRDLESERNSEIWARDRAKNIPNVVGGGDAGFRPPPRPPVSSAASRMESSSTSHSSHSSQSSEPSPSALASALFMIVSGGSQSDGGEDDTPPAIPPRASRIKKQTRPVSSAQDFMESMRQLKDCGWYWGPLSWEEAELKLNNKPEGTFLVRDSSDERYILSLSFKNMGRVHHTRIEHHKGHFSFWSQPDSHGKSTIKEFIEQCVTNSQNGRFLYFIRPSGPGSPPMPIHLLYPVSRFVQMRSLQHMCRFTILQIVRRDHIDDLPVPTRIKQYLKEAQYYVEYLDD